MWSNQNQLQCLCKIGHTQSRAWWRTPLIPVLRRQRQADFWVRGQPTPQSEFQDSHGFTEKPCLKKNHKITTTTTTTTITIVNVSVPKTKKLYGVPNFLFHPVTFLGSLTLESLGCTTLLVNNSLSVSLHTSISSFILQWTLILMHHFYTLLQEHPCRDYNI